MSETLHIDPDTVIWSAPEDERAGRPLLVLMHGKGSDERDLAGLVGRLPADFVMASVRALLPDGPGFSWFVGHAPGSPSQDEVDAAADAVLAWLAGVATDDPAVGVLGFSQGGAMAVHLLRRAPERVEFAVNLSGFVVEAVEPGDELIARHPVFWGRGDVDLVIPPAAIERTAGWLPAHVDLTAIVYPGLAHSISGDELDDIAAFLAARL